MPQRPTTIPDSHRDLLTGRTVALSTVNDDGTIQTTAVWVVLGADGVLRTSLAKGRVKHRNLRKRPYATVLSISPDNPFRTIEIRANVELSDDPDKGFFGQLLETYGQTLDAYSEQAAEDRDVVTFLPTRVRTAG